ncbi:MAG: hypothetical protein RL264_567 [Bacteroidota bacterium]|jgi:hypothetical protein
MLVLLTLFVQGLAFSQRNMRPAEFTLSGGRAFYTFLYKDQTPEDYLNFEYKQGFAYNARFALQFRYKNLLRFEAGAFQAGSRAIYAGNLIQWNLNYLSLGTSYIFKFIDKESRDEYSVYGGLNFNSSYLVKGQQIVNKLNYNLKDTEAFKLWNFHGGLIVGGRYFATQRVILSIEYRFDCSLGQIEGQDNASGQISRNIGHVATVGVGFNLR